MPGKTQCFPGAKLLHAYLTGRAGPLKRYLTLTEGERRFLEAWSWDGIHFAEPGEHRAKRQQVARNRQGENHLDHRLGTIIGAAFTLEEQVALWDAGAPNYDEAPWPWSSLEELDRRYREAKEITGDPVELEPLRDEIREEATLCN